MLCFWVLFWEHLEENGTPTGAGGLVRQTWRIMHSVIRKALGGEVWSIDIESLRNLNRQTAENNKTLKYALEFADFAGNEFSCTLHKLFERTLAYDPDQRGDFKEISDMLLNRKSNDVPAKPTKNTKEGMMSIPKPSDFKVSRNAPCSCVSILTSIQRYPNLYKPFVKATTDFEDTSFNASLKNSTLVKHQKSSRSLSPSLHFAPGLGLALRGSPTRPYSRAGDGRPIFLLRISRMKSRLRGCRQNHSTNVSEKWLPMA